MIVKAATSRANRALAKLLAHGGDPDEQTLARATIACNALEGVVRHALLDSPEKLNDPAWVDQVVKLTSGFTG